MTLKHYHSPVIAVTPGCTIGEAIEMMQVKKIGSLLIVQKEHPEVLEGIFTERDVLMQCYKLKVQKFWAEPIENVMTRNPRCLTPDQLKRAGEMMLDYSFRHVPVKIIDEAGLSILIGVVSIRDVLKNLIDDNKKLKSRIRHEIARVNVDEVLVLSQNPRFRTLMDETIQTLLKLKTDHFLRKLDENGVATLKNLKKDIDCAIIDLDSYSTHEWVDAVKTLNHHPSEPKILIIHNPDSVPPQTHQTLEKLNHSGRIYVFEKPLDLYKFTETIDPLFSTI